MREEMRLSRTCCHRLLLALLLCGRAAAGAAQVVPADSARGIRAEALPADTARALRPPGAEASAWPVLGLGAAALAVLPLDEGITRTLRAHELQADGRLSDLADGLRLFGAPGTLVIAGSLYAAGLLGGDRGTAVLGLRGLEAIGVVEVAVLAGKTLVGRARPDVDPGEPLDVQLGRGLEGDRYHSFPSGHTAVAFAFASALTAESRHCCADRTRHLGPVLYGAAALVGASRIYDGRHWASDVLAGAAVGTLTGLRVVQYHHRSPGGLPDRWLLPRAAAPLERGVLLVWVLPAP